MRGKRISARERLLCMPDVFTQRSLASMFSWDRQKASTFLFLWGREGRVKGLGARTGVFFNLEKNPNADKELFLNAIDRYDPLTVLVDATTLHASGATTQIPQEIDIAYTERRSIPHIKGTVSHKRPNWWYDAVRYSFINDHAIPRLSPEMAIADAWAFNGWKPDPDDLDFDELDEEKFKEAFEIMKTPLPRIYFEDSKGYGFC